jgi:hypothetical protein
MAKKRDIERAPLVMMRTRNGLAPVSAHDDELLADYAIGSMVEITVKQRRSLPQLRTYFAMLAYVNKLTDAYPTVEKLNEALKMHLGYVTTVRRFDGEEITMADSIAFAAMDQAAFKVFFDQAVKALAEKFRFDPLSFMTETERRAA